MSVRITCIKKDNGHHQDSHEAITDLGWLNESTGEKNFSTRIQMVEFIRDKKGLAYVTDQFGGKAYLEVKLSLHGTWFVKTKPDSTNANNLLSLPECI